MRPKRLKTRGIISCGILAASFGGALSCQADVPAVAAAGQPAPVLIFEKVLQVPEVTATDWASLKGRTVVLEFWATWCGPCVGLIPHLNKLHDEWNEKGIEFIAVTDEEEAVVREFLKTNPVKGCVALDTDGSVFRAYRIRGRPDAVVVDATGKLVGWVSPAVLVAHPDILADVLSGKKNQLVSDAPSAPGPDPSADVQNDFPRLEAEAHDPPLLMLVVRRAQEAEGLPYAGDARGIRYNAVTPREALARAYDVPVPFLILNAPLSDKERYDVVFRCPHCNPGFARNILQNALHVVFGVAVRREIRETEVQVLSLVGDARPQWEAAPPSFKYDAATGLTAPTEELLKRMKAGEMIKWTNGSTAVLAGQLSELLGRTVVDEAHIEGNFVFCFPSGIDTSNVQAVSQALREKYGLTLKTEKRKIETVVVENAGGNKGGNPD